MNAKVPAHDPKLDLVLSRVVQARPERVWLAWTEPEQLKKWFTPAPWTMLDAEVDLCPGGAFKTVMRSPAGEDSVQLACYLEVVFSRRLIWSTALAPGFRPVRPADGAPAFTAIVTLEPHELGTHYTATALHENAERARLRTEMGFYEGWGQAFDQLTRIVEST